MSRTLTRNTQRADTVMHCEETTGSRGHGCYSLVRFYDREGRTFRVTLHRDNYVAQSRAVAEVLTPAFTWTAVIDNPASNWHGSTSIWHDTPTGLVPETGFETLRQLADELVRKAMSLVPA